MGSGKVGRNDSCPCGSGKKYKQCCERKEHTVSPVVWVVIVGAGLAALAALVMSFTASAPVISSANCPPGQSWSIEHGHCH